MVAPGDDGIVGALATNDEQENKARRQSYTPDPVEPVECIDDRENPSVSANPEPYGDDEIKTFGPLNTPFYLVEGGGTSAAAFVAGTVAVVRSLDGEMGPQETVPLILNMADRDFLSDRSIDTADSTYGYGLLNVGEAGRHAALRR